MVLAEGIGHYRKHGDKHSGAHRLQNMDLRGGHQGFLQARGRRPAIGKKFQVQVRGEKLLLIRQPDKLPYRCLV